MFLQLKNGDRFSGVCPDWMTGSFPGEVVFSTGMTGYPESLTDPSYKGQILIFTYPLIGNYGVPRPDEFESKNIHVAGVVMGESCKNWSHKRNEKSIEEWLSDQKIPYITEVDTRAVTKALRTHGTLLGTILTDETIEPTYLNPHDEHLVQKTSTQTITRTGKGKRVLLIDCGMKENIWRSMQKFPVEIVRVPYNFNPEDEEYDGILVSNGPGDPIKCLEVVENLKRAMKYERPIFGICLGVQLIALAAGAKTFKLPFGHRGHNVPCQYLKTKRSYITSQNHGYAIEPKSVPNEWNITFQNLNDGSVEGIAHKEKPFMGVQFHPEAAPGPTDTAWLFEEFVKCL